MKKLHKTFDKLGAFAMFGMLAGAAGCQGTEDPDTEGTTQALQPKVLLCHRLRTISVAQPAVAAHLQHGDTLGACADAGEDAGEDAGLEDDAAVETGE